MRRIAIPIILLFLFAGAQPAHANGAPAADVTCSLSDTGVRYGVSMVFTGTGISFSSLRYEWEYQIADSGKNPTQVSSYGPRTSHTVTTVNALDLTYESMLSFAKNDAGASVLLYASSIFSDGTSTITNRTGKGCYVELPVVLKNKNERVIAVQKAAAEKAAADLAAAQKSELDRQGIETSLQNARLNIQNADDLIAKVSSSSPTMKGNLIKFANSRPSIPQSIPQGFTYANAVELEQRSTQYLKNLNTFIATMSKNLANTITCVKGKTKKSVTGKPAKCPAGYKQK
jgi:hypothetical protein